MRVRTWGAEPRAAVLVLRVGLSDDGAPMSLEPLLEELGVLGLQRKGKEVWARCPAHDEKTGSWSILDDATSERHGAHFCFGCGFAGGLPQLVKAIHGSTFDAALDWLEQRGWMRGAPPGDAPAGTRVVLAKTKPSFRLPPEVVIAPLDQWPSPLKRYALKRGLTPEDVMKWGLGYSVDGKLGTRIVFPVREGGRIQTYSARAVDGSTPKYLAPKTRDGADASAMFGSSRWPASGSERDVVVLTEGAMDAVAVHRATGLCVAAEHGSELRERQLGRLSTFKTVIVASDPDAAGEKVREAAAALRRYCRVRYASFLARDDAAALAQREGDEALDEVIRGAAG